MFESSELPRPGRAESDTDQPLPFHQRRFHRPIGHDEPAQRSRPSEVGERE